MHNKVRKTKQKKIDLHTPILYYRLWSFGRDHKVPSLKFYVTLIDVVNIHRRLKQTLCHTLVCTYHSHCTVGTTDTKTKTSGSGQLIVTGYRKADLALGCHHNFFFLYIKRALAKGKQKHWKKKFSLVARSCKEDSRRNKVRGGFHLTLEVF